MNRIIFETKAFSDFNNWANEDKRIYKKIISLIKDIQRNPFSGIGKPEALKYELSGAWSRRIDEEHRLVYVIKAEDVIILSCKYHY